MTTAIAMEEGGIMHMTNEVARNDYIVVSTFVYASFCFKYWNVDSHADDQLQTAGFCNRQSRGWQILQD